ncbi:MAG: DUF4065 domain-containing protein [Bifidobacteriaceae bacterium]|jgi:uncharacterized phage-associated protein|nr:DUF4065 domain-containing protein [Bifidobacteriaceae bacterium]
MANVNDVAAYILTRTGEITTMKLHKLTYYAQAWHLAWDGLPIFAEPIEAWRNGPVIPELYRQHKGTFTVCEWPSGDPSRLTEAERETVDVMLKGYGDLPPSRLSQLTHREDPWVEARHGLQWAERGNNPISLDTMQDYYGSLIADD